MSEVTGRFWFFVICYLLLGLIVLLTVNQ